MDYLEDYEDFEDFEDYEDEAGTFCQGWFDEEGIDDPLDWYWFGCSPGMNECCK